MLKRVDAVRAVSLLDVPEALDIALFARSLGEEPGVGEAAARTVDQALQITGARWAEIVAVRDATSLQVLGSSDPSTTRALMRARRDSGEGPEVPGAGTAVDTVVIDDLSTDRRWPAFARLAHSETGVRSAVLQYILVGDRYAAVLPVYDDRPGYFTKDHQRRVRVLAELAGSALAGLAAHEQAQQLAYALETNRTIATALGIVMAARGLSRDDAFVVLREASQRHQRKLHDVADDVILTGSLPD